jgi:hypothetical protein
MTCGWKYHPMFGEGKKLGMRGGPPVPFRKVLAGMM